jgi:hypothetical protein
MNESGWIQFVDADLAAPLALSVSPLSELFGGSLLASLTDLTH